MCVANDLKLHLIKPLGFEITDKYLKRSALDYWEHLDYQVYESWDNFLENNPITCSWFLTTKSTKSFWEVNYKQGNYLIFGPETRGLPEDLLKTYADKAITVPMRSKNSRSLNLASTVQTVYYEAFRQLIKSD